MLISFRSHVFFFKTLIGDALQSEVVTLKERGFDTLQCRECCGTIILRATDEQSQVADEIHFGAVMGAFHRRIALRSARFRTAGYTS